MLLMALNRWTRKPTKGSVWLTVSLAGVLAIWLAVAPAANAASCPQVVNPANFASKAQLRKMTAKFNSFGPRVLGSSAHNKAIDWLEKKARGDRAQRPLAAFQALRLVTPHPFQARTRSRHRCRGRAQRDREPMGRG